MTDEGKGEVKGFVTSLLELKGHTDVPGHPGLSVYRFTGPGQGSRWLQLSLNVVEQGGGVEPHYHEGPDFDHAFYVTEGEVIATVGDREHRLGPHSLMFFPSGEVHGFRVVSPEGAKVLRLGASPTGAVRGGSVFIGKEKGESTSS